MDVSDRAAARQLERSVLATYAPWRADAVGPIEFPQGGWTETSLDHPDAPECDLDSLAESLCQQHSAGLRDGVD